MSAEIFGPKLPSVAEPVIRSVGVTDSERYLQRLADQTFLSMWSYAGLFRNQGHASKGKGDGKEIADLIAVFDNHVLIFSDKECVFQTHQDSMVCWKRWYGKTIQAGAKQVLGAERWIREHPDRLFLDRSCTNPFPLPIPDPTRAKFHRIVVAHGASSACHMAYGGSGSLMIDTTIKGDLRSKGATHPFTIGQVCPDKGYVHVFDDTTLRIVLSTLDTVSDFVRYLSIKERFLSGDVAVRVAGEEELLARYLQTFDVDHHHDLSVPSGISAIFLAEGGWDAFRVSRERRAQFAANEISYGWDSIIEKFAHHKRAGTSYPTPHNITFQETERVLRFMAREDRTRRRMLSEALVEISELERGHPVNARVVPPSHVDDPHYVFVIMKPLDTMGQEEYRTARRNLLQNYCLVTRYLHPTAKDIVGLATEDHLSSRREVSEDLGYLDGRSWTAEDAAEARRLHERVGLFSRTNMYEFHSYEYPVSEAVEAQSRLRRIKGKDRNLPCPCRSGRKYKHCHGRLR